MIATSLDVLYISLAIGVFLVSVFFCVVLLYLIMILRDVVKIADKTRDTMDQINEYVMKPIVFMQSIKKFIDPIVDRIHDKVSKGDDDDEDDD